MISKIIKLIEENKLNKQQAPFFIFDKQILNYNINYFKNKFDLKFENIFYSIKSNYHQDILLELNKLNCRFEIASSFELDILTNLNIEPQKVIFSNPVKIPNQIKRAFDAGVRIFAYDTESELKKISQNAPKSNVYLRINISNEGADWTLDEKFGANLEDTFYLLQKAKSFDLKPIGITFHNGWNNQNIATWKQNIQIAKNIVEQCFTQNIELQFVNLGGGFPAHNVEQYQLLDNIATAINPVLNYLKNKFGVETYAEPGSFIVNNIGGLVIEIYDIINRNGLIWVFVNSGIMQGFPWILSGLRYEIVLLKNENHDKKQNYIITGPTNDSKDIFGTFSLNANLQIGDLLFVYPAGAYSYSSEKYNSYAIPKVLIL